MVKLVGPCMSLSATGELGKALFYYESPYGPVVRLKKRYMGNAAQVWYLNQTWFKAASDRAKQLTQEQKWAWQTAYPLICDTWRDIFMGRQIEAWNMSPENDLTWPQITPSVVTPLFFDHGVDFYKAGFHRMYFSTYLLEQAGFSVIEFKEAFRKNCSNFIYWVSVNAGFTPNGENSFGVSRSSGVSFAPASGLTYYMWGGIRYINGTYSFVYIGEYTKP